MRLMLTTAACLAAALPLAWIAANTVNFARQGQGAEVSSIDLGTAQRPAAPRRRKDR